MRLAIFLIIAFSLFIPDALAAPAFSTPSPANGSYIYGKDTDLFSINIVDSSLNTATAKLHIRVDDPTSLWANISLSCSNTSLSNWNCNTTVPGLSALTKDGNVLLYYFDAYNTNNEYGYYSNSTSPTISLVDRTAPLVSITLPANNSYAGGNATISITASDKLSSINSSSVKYSFDNATFKDTTATGNTYQNSEQWNTGGYSDNQSITIYAAASDAVENKNNAFITVLIDNELPRITSISPLSNQILSGTYSFSLTAEDTYSGLDPSSAFFQVGNSNETMSCSGGTCTKSHDTTKIADGNYVVNFFISDKVGNRKNSSAGITIDNLPPTITITSPSSGQTVQGIITINATVVDDVTGVKTVRYRWEHHTNFGNWIDMPCSAFCSSNLNMANFEAGDYNITIKASDNMNHEASSYVKIKISSTGGSSPVDQNLSKVPGTPDSSSPGSSGSTSPGSPGFPGGPSPGAPGSQTPSPGTESAPSSLVCGNRACQPTETCVSCEADCGKCGILDLPTVLLDSIINSPLLKSDEGKIIFFSGLLSAIAVVVVLLKKFNVVEKLMHR